jgi:hypothetical protein
MYPTYDESMPLFVIEWFERKDKKATPIRHYFEQKPVKLQLHPKDPKKIVRVHFTGKMPGWIKAYCEHKEHRFTCEEVRFGNETGWILLGWHNFSSEFQPLVSPSLKGAIQKLAARVPEFFPELKQQLLDHADVASRNLANYNDIFENIGVFYRPEEFVGQEGCLVIDHSVFLQREKDESEEDYIARYKADGNLDKIVRELTNLLPDPTPDEEVRVDPDPLEEELVGTLTAANDEEILGSLSPSEEEEEIIAELSPDIEDEKVHGELTPEDEVLGELKPVEEDGDDGDIGTLKPTVGAIGENPPLNPEEDNEEITSTPVSGEASISAAGGVVLPTDETMNVESDLKFVILDYSDKRRGVMEGQMSIF